MSARKTVAGFAAIAAVGASLYAVSITSAAGTRAATTERRIVNCQTTNANIQIRTSGSGVTISSDSRPPTLLLAVKSKDKQYTVGNACRGTRKHSPLGPGGFPSTHAPTVDCDAPRHVILRLVLAVDDAGLPVSAKLEVTQARFNFKPLAYVQWTPDQSTTYYRPHSCTAQN